MKIESLNVTNFRGIKSVSMKDLQTLVVIAGQNGSGKSCVLDAIRLLKSVYGGYQQNEWQHWAGEFQVNFNNPGELATLFNDRHADLRITCEFSIHSEEREYIRQNCEDLVRQSVWRALYPEMYAWRTIDAIPFAAHLRNREADIKELTQKELEVLKAELTKDRVVGEFLIAPGQQAHVRPSKLLEVVFGTFRPHFLGVIDYHGPHRTYVRETLQGINLNLDAIEQQRSAHALYNYANKYTNVKSEMAASYIKEILASRAGENIDGQQSLSITLTELFQTFFPHKEFLGPSPTVEGSLKFPVKTADGAIHDLNELSAGEKEILYGYLRLRNSAPRYSVILLDEPELHLNPGLVRGLPAFYQKHLGTALENQIWLITHSDALLRQAVGRDDCSVYHMQTASSSAGAQMTPLQAKEGLEKAVIDLVGDLASYRPNAKLIIFEGENCDFDERITTILFPRLREAANTVSAGNKQRVRGLHQILSIALEKGEVPMKIFSITDSDASNSGPLQDHNRSLSWDAYHIENYLLEPRFILKVVKELGVTSFPREEDVYVKLRDCAEETMGGLVRHLLGTYVNEQLISCIRTGTDPKASEIAPALADAVRSSAEKVSNVVRERLDLPQLQAREEELRIEFKGYLAADSWRKKFRGRDILSRFAGHIHKTTYEVFRDLIIARMADAGFQPDGMRAVIDKVLAT